MKKSEIIDFFGGSQIKTAKALGITRGAVCNWDDELSIDVQNRIIATAVRNGFLQKLIKAFPSIQELKE